MSLPWWTTRSMTAAAIWSSPSTEPRLPDSRLVVITTNLEFSRWGAVFGDDQMAAAVIDRIVHHGRLVQFRGESYRVRHALMQDA